MKKKMKKKCGEKLGFYSVFFDNHLKQEKKNSDHLKINSKEEKEEKKCQVIR